MRRFISTALFYVGLVCAAHGQGGLTTLGVGGSDFPHYVGPGDIISGATSWYGLRGYNQAYANGGANPAVTVRRASDNTTTNVAILNTGKLDVASANSFAGTDATCTGTAAASTTLALTACSSTPTAGDTLTSTGGSGSFTQPAYIVSCGAFGGGAGNCTLNTAQTVTGVTVKAQVGLYVSEWFDQSGNGIHALQATAANQPELLPSCINGLPCVLFSGSQYLFTTNCGNTGLPLFEEVVTRANITGGGYIFVPCHNVSSDSEGLDVTNTTTWGTFGGTGFVNFTVNPALAVWHSVQLFVPFFPASVTPTVDGTTLATINPGNTWFTGGPGPGGAGIGSNSSLANPYFGVTTEIGTWQINASTVQTANICANGNSYWLAGSLPCTFTAPAVYTAVTAPCDLVTCGEAWSVTRAMKSSYTGPLFQLYNGSTLLDIGQVPGTRVVDMTTWSAFCSGVQSNCKISRIYAQINNSNNDMVAVDYDGGIFGGPVTCVSSFTNCMAPFTIEVATGLPIVTLPAVGPYEYSGNGSLVNVGHAPNNAGDDLPLIGVNGGTNSHTVVMNAQAVHGGAGDCCGEYFGPAHKAQAVQLIGSDFGAGLFWNGSNFLVGPLGEGHGNGDAVNTQLATIPNGMNYIEIIDHVFAPVPFSAAYINGGTLMERSPLVEVTNLFSGPYIHLGGGGDLSQPAPVFFREGLITNSVLSLNDRTNIFGNETAFYSALTYPAFSNPGPGDVVPGAAAWYGLRGYTAAFAAPGTNKAINVRRSTDNATTDVAILPSGNLDTYSANGFGGIDATCTGSTSGSSTTISFTGCSSTPHAGDVLYSSNTPTAATVGAPILPPSYIVSCGTFTGGAGTCTMNAVQNLSASQTVVALNPLYVTKMYDQTGNGHDMVQATAANQPQLIPLCLAPGPCLLFSGNQWLTASCGPSSLPYYTTAVAQRTGNFSARQDIFDSCSSGGSSNNLGFNVSANTVQIADGSTLTAAANDNVLHELQATTPASSGNSTLTVDNSATTGAAGNTWFTGGNASIGATASGGSPMTGYLTMAGNWPSTLTGTQVTNLCHNDNLYWFASSGAALSC